LTELDLDPHLPLGLVVVLDRSAARLGVDELDHPEVAERGDVIADVTERLVQLFGGVDVFAELGEDRRPSGCAAAFAASTADITVTKIPSAAPVLVCEGLDGAERLGVRGP
jgi:hypothetical protein